jgi:hypothetical protein
MQMHTAGSLVNRKRIQMCSFTAQRIDFFVNKTMVTKSTEKNNRTENL